MYEPTLTAVCLLPGCQLPVAEFGEPCPDCLRAFGPMLRPIPDTAPYTQDQINARDQEALAAYRAMNAQAKTDDETERRNQIC